MTAKMVRGATTQRLSALLSLLGIAGGAAAASAPLAPAPDVRSSLAPADSERGRNEAADNWDIHFLNSTTVLDANTSDEVVLRYDIGKGSRNRVIEAAFLARGCADPVAGIEVNKTREEVLSKDDDYDSLTVGYGVAPSALKRSNLWNNVTNAVEFCHVLKLFLPAGGALGDLEVSSDARDFTVKILTDFNFTLGVVPAGAPIAIGMRIFGWLNFTNFVDGGLANDALERTFAWHAGNATDAMGRGQEVASVSILANVVEDGDSAYYYELNLREPCYIACKDLVNSTTMYENVTDHLAEAFADGSFLATFKRFRSAPPAARRGLSAPAAAPAEGSAVADPGRRLQDALTFFFEPKPPPGEDYSNGRSFAVVIRPVDDDVRYESAAADLGDFVEACRCGGARSFACDVAEAPLSPNDELNVCVRSRSADLVVDSLDSMVLTQGSATLDVIEDDEVRIKAIATREYVPGRNGVAVAARVPSNVFVFAAGRSLTIRGLVRAKFAGGGRRELGAAPGAGDGRDLRAAAEEAPFKLEVALAGEEGAPDSISLTDSAAVMKKGIVAVGTVFGVVYNLLW